MLKGSLGCLSCIVTKAAMIPCFWIELDVSYKPRPAWGLIRDLGSVMAAIIRPTLCNRKMKTLRHYLSNILARGSCLTPNGSFTWLLGQVKASGNSTFRFCHFSLNHQYPRWPWIEIFLDQTKPSHSEDKMSCLQALQSLPLRLASHA